MKKNKSAPVTFRDLFRAHVTSTAFHLTLSQGMIDLMLQLHDLGACSPDDRGVIAEPGSHFIQHAWALIRRGLVGHMNPYRGPEHYRDRDYRPGYYLTPAGAKVAELLKLAGFGGKQ